MKFWWVSHGSTFKESISSGYLWSPKVKQSGQYSQFYDNMTQVEPGDVVFSYAQAQIQAVGVVARKAETSPIPSSFISSKNPWAEVGWHVEVDFTRLQNPFRTKEHTDYLRGTLSPNEVPFDKNGEGKQGTYLSEVPDSMVERLLVLLGDDFHMSLALAGGNLEGADDEANEAELLVTQRTDIGATHIAQLVKARRGQGVYKSNVKGIEKFCRVTKLELPQHLIASHIKPWAKSSDFEKLDGHNGLLLSPHIDHLFDRGYISFENNGQLITSPKLQYRVLDVWHIDPDVNVGKFTKEQQGYLEHHRDVTLKLSAI